MKMMLALLLAAAMLAGGALADTGAEAANRLGLQLLADTWDGAHNLLLSPVSLAYALDMAAAGAEGETCAELKFCDAPEWNGALSAAGLKWANAAFLREDLAVKPEYREVLERDFGAALFSLEDPDAVNAWVEARTDGMIDRLVDDIDPRTRLLLLNAVAMDARWDSPFEAIDTQADTFHAPGGDVTADFMRQTMTAPYAEGELGQAVRLDYRDGGLYLLAVLPEEGRLPEALAALAEDPLGGLGEMTPREVALGLPKLDLAVENKLSEALQARGIRRAFTEEAELTGISDEPLMISDVLQKARLQLDEEGVRAAAATEAAVSAKGALAQTPVFLHVNRPFLLLICEEVTGAVCFAAVVCDPTQN